MKRARSGRFRTCKPAGVPQGTSEGIMPSGVPVFLNMRLLFPYGYPKRLKQRGKYKPEGREARDCFWLSQLLQLSARVFCLLSTHKRYPLLAVFLLRCLFQSLILCRENAGCVNASGTKRDNGLSKQCTYQRIFLAVACRVKGPRLSWSMSFSMVMLRSLSPVRRKVSSGRHQPFNQRRETRRTLVSSKRAVAA